MFEDWLAINRLLMRYAQCIDAAEFAEGATLFEHATFRLHPAGVGEPTEYYGSEPVERFFKATRVYPDGTPRTKHVITNVDIQLDGDRANSRCYVTVFQQTDDFPLQPIASGQYVDQFERVDGQWRFSDRLLAGFLLGDRSHHVDWHADGPPGN